MDIFGHPARILQMGNSEALLEIVKARHAPDPSIFDKKPPFFFPAEISSDRLDTYYTRMAVSTLRNFAADANNGVSFQNSHSTTSLGFGRSVVAEYDDAVHPRVTAWIYTLPGLNLNGVNTDDLITGVRSGLVKDVSIGFYQPRFVCDICGRQPLRDMACRHVPGIEYPHTDETSGQTNQRRAFAWVEDARLGEISAVYEGSTPGAAILKANMEAQAGRLTDVQRYLIENRYRIVLPERRIVVPGIELPELPAETEPGQADLVIASTRSTDTTGAVPNTEVSMNEYEALRAALVAELGGSAELDPLDFTRGLKTNLDAATRTVAELETRALTAEARVTELTAQVDGLQGQVADLAPKAKDGEAYRADLIAETLAEGVRAEGSAFPVDIIRVMLEGQGLDAIRTMRDHYRTLAAINFQGGRRSVDPDPKPKTETAKSETGKPDSSLPNYVFNP